MKKRLLRLWNSIKNRTKIVRKRTLTFVDKRPFATFLVVLGIVFILIVISNIIGNIKPKTEEQPVPVKEVQTYQVGSVPTIKVQAHVEKSGVITITALTGGVVQKIYKENSEHFTRGQTLVGLSSNYQGGSLFSLQRQLAQTQYDNVIGTFDNQKETLKQQRELAEKNDANADELRTITDKSLSETRDLINLNETILSSIDQNLANLEQTNVNGSNDALILSTQQLKSQFLAATNGAKQGLRNAEFQASGDKQPAQLSNLQKDLALKQLDIQEKMLEMNREVNRIQLNIARVNEGLMFPTAPFSGTVERVFVKVGQAVSPGTELMVLGQDAEDDPITAVALVSADIAGRVSELDKSTIHIDSKTSYAAFPSYISNEAVNGTLYAIYFPIPDTYSATVTDTGFISIDIPIGYSDTASFIPYVPIDAIYQTRDQNFLFIAENGAAASRAVSLGQIYGNYIEITSGLHNGDQVLLDRTVVAGDKVTTPQ